jgi:hypothetical protein
MLVNKKFDRFKQWAGEKMGSEAKTTTSDDFKALELEMNLRHDGSSKSHVHLGEIFDNVLTMSRYGPVTQINEPLRESNWQEERRRGCRQAIANWLSGYDNGWTWPRIFSRVGVWTLPTL